MYKQTWQEILKHQNFLLHLHVGPDGDSVGSSLAMYHTLKDLNKNVTLISGDSSFPQNLKCYPG
jgi:phosphoesterase RecJ-like protein